MIEFTINRNRSGKKSRWAKKYPRKRKLYDICKRAKETHKKQLLGTFYISTGLYKTRKATVYVASKLDYVASYFYMGIAKIAQSV